jgi:hypothetical protein
MPHATTPHTESQQNKRPESTDLEPNQLEQTAGTGADANLYRNNEGAQTGTNRGRGKHPGPASRPNTEPFATAHEGQVTTRTPHASGQGITSHSVEEENARQQKVVKHRPDAKAGVNRDRK